MNYRRPRCFLFGRSSPAFSLSLSLSLSIYLSTENIPLEYHTTATDRVVCVFADVAGRYDVVGVVDEFVSLELGLSTSPHVRLYALHQLRLHRPTPHSITRQ